MFKTNVSRKIDLLKSYVTMSTGWYLFLVCELTDNSDCSPENVMRFIWGNVYLKKHWRLNLLAARKRGSGKIYKSSLTVSQGGC